MPQGSFLVLIDDMHTGCTVHKYIDDTTLSELLRDKQSDTQMPTFLAKLLDWSSDNDMQLNTSKTKEMILGPLAQSDIPSLTISSGAIERFNSFKLLGLYIDFSLSCTWSTHVENITKKATSRLCFLKQLKRAGVSEKHLLHFHTTVIRPILEYCAPVWHYGLTRTGTAAGSNKKAGNPSYT